MYVTFENNVSQCVCSPPTTMQEAPLAVSKHGETYLLAGWYAPTAMNLKHNSNGT